MLNVAWLPSVAPEEAVQVYWDYSADLAGAHIVTTPPDDPVITVSTWRRSREIDPDADGITTVSMIVNATAGIVYQPVSGMKPYVTYRIACVITSNETPPRTLELVSMLPCVPR